MFVKSFIASLIHVTIVSCQVTGTYPVEVTQTGASAPSDAPSAAAETPKCTRDCVQLISQLSSGGQSSNASATCAAEARAPIAACEVLTCSDTEYQSSQEQANEVCSPVYAKTPTLASEVSTAIASATAAAQSTVANNDYKVISAYPPCSQASVPSGLIAGGCNGFSDINCVCHCQRVEDVLAAYQQVKCPVEDLETITYLVLALCVDAGGFYPKVPEACGANGTGTAYATGSKNATTTKPTAGVGSVVPFISAGQVLGSGIVMVAMTSSIGIMLAYAL